MVYILIPVVYGIAIQLIDAHNVIRKSNLEISYHGTMNNTCDVEEYRFQAIMNSKLSDCVIECALREHCAVMNYHPDNKLCELHQNDTGPSNLTGNCFRMVREDIHITQSPCVDISCPNGTTCDTTSGICKIKECLEVPRLKNGKVRGNLRAVGNRIEYECDEGYRLVDDIHDVSECLENGTWTTRGECVIDYIASSVGHLCNATNCLDPSVRCVAKYIGEEYCHCNFGFEFDTILEKCIEVCKEYSTNSSDYVVRHTGDIITGYNLIPNSQRAKEGSLQGCINYCSTYYPLFLSIEVYQSDTECSCSAISEQQQIFAHNALVASTASGSLINRPCVIHA